VSVDAKKEVEDIDLETAAKKVQDLRNDLLFSRAQDSIDCSPFAAALLLQALGVLDQAAGLLKQADMMRARELAGNF